MKSESEVAQSCPTLRPHGLQPTRLLQPWDFPGKSTGVGCHCLLRKPQLVPHYLEPKISGDLWSGIHSGTAGSSPRVLGYKASSSSPVWNVILTCEDHSATSPADGIPLASFSLRVSRHGSNCHLLCEKNIQTTCSISRGILQWQEQNLLPEF